MKLPQRVMCFVCICTLVCVLGISSAFASFTGSLSSSSVPAGILGHGAWVESGVPTTFSWTVTEGVSLWHYEYTLTVPETAGAVSHMIIETSLNLEYDDIINPSNSIEDNDPKWYTSDSSNPLMPDSVFGIKFQAMGTTFMVDFYCPRSPVWGDFYAIDGKKPGEEQAAWNAGFAFSDPTAAPSNGSIDYHVLVPDTTEKIPAPGAILLSSIGVSLVHWLRRRRTL